MAGRQPLPPGLGQGQGGCTKTELSLQTVVAPDVSLPPGPPGTPEKPSRPYRKEKPKLMS